MYYPLSFLDNQMGLSMGAFTAIGLALYLVRGRNQIDRESAVLLEAWLFGGRLIITLVSKKQPFYAIPILAPAAACAAIGFRALPDVRGFVGVALVVAALGLHQGSFLTRGEGIWPAPGRWTWFAGTSPLPPGYLGKHYTQAAPPHGHGLDIERMAHLCSTSTDRDADRTITMLFSDAQGAYEGQLMPALRLELDSLQVEGVLMSGQAVQEKVDHASCFIYVTGTNESWPTHDRIRQVWADWGVGTPPAALYQAMDTMQARSLPPETWTTERNELVHVFALAGPPQE
jgi:hypothetical protein